MSAERKSVSAEMEREIPTQDQICGCGHWWEEHDQRNEAQPCDVPECECMSFHFDWTANTPEAVADRGGDPSLWPQHITEALELAEEFEENGLNDVAEYLREHGAAATREWIDGEIAEARENDDPEGWVLGNLEVARDRLGRLI